MDGTFEFTIAGGQVTAEEAVFGQHTRDLRIPSDASFSVGTGMVTETIAGTHATETIQFTAEPANASLFQVTSDARTILAPATTDAAGHVFGFSFTVAGGAVTAEQVVFGASAADEHMHTLRSAPDATFTASGATVTETSVQGDAVDTTTYVQTGAAGLYAIASQSQTVIPEGTATTALSVDPFERAEFTFGASGAVATVSAVHDDGTTSVFTPRTGETFSQLATGVVEETITHGSHSSFVVFADGNGDGIYTAVAHGEGSTVDLAGLQTQLTTVTPFL